MACNKDDAERCKEIAANKLGAGDYEGALRLAKKGQHLCPQIPNIKKIITICDVHIAAANRLSHSERDLYAILGTERFSNDTTIKKNYKELILLLHPDKNLQL